ncbi:MAG: trehalose-phosphatase [Verrucomicrobia bacterium]|nr:MAG: trehalose-phosphatase [Verrucomicrobiota bacterium]
MIPSALEHVHEIAEYSDRIAVFLDYDGTLTPIVSHPQDAWLPDSMRQTLRSLAARVPVAILSGRDLDDVRGRVLVDGIVYAGSHGFDIAGAGGLRRELGAACLSVLDEAETELREELDEIPGAQLERKHLSVAAHYRNVKQNDAFRVALAMDEVAARHRELRRIDGKKVYELLPDIDWNKGKAVLWLLETLGLERRNVLPIYIGDDRTDEDAFRAIEKRGVAILVSEQPQITAASYWLNNPEDVERFLRELIARLPA